MVRPQMIFLLSLLVFATVKAVQNKKERYVRLERFLIVRRIRELTMKYLLETRASSMIIVVVHPKVSSDISDIIIQTCLTRVPTFVIKDDNIVKNCSVEEICGRIRHLIAIYDQIDDIRIDHLLNMFGKQWSPRSPVAIWILNDSSGTFEEILKNFWSLYDSLNIVLLALNKISGEVNIFSYNPFLSTFDEQKGLVYELTHSDVLFPDKIANIRGHGIPISMYHRVPQTVMRNYTEPERGIDVQILQAIAAWLNFTIDIKTARVDAIDYIVHLPNGSQVGMIGDLLTNKSSALWNVQYVEIALNKKVEFVYPIAMTDYRVIVPKSQMIPLILQIFLYISPSMSIAIALTLGFLIVCLILKRERNVILRTLDLFLHQQFPRILNTNYNRIFSLSWIIWSSVIITVLQNSLIKNIMIPRFYEDIETLEQLYDSKLTLMIGESMLNTLKYSYVPDRKRLADRAVEQLDFRECAKRLLKSRDVACGIDRYSVADMLNNMFYRDETVHGHVVKERLNEYWLTFFVKDGFPFLDKFSLGIKRLSNSGIVRKWARDDFWIYLRSAKINSKNKQILTLKELHGLFYILLLGYGISTLVFIVELSCRRPIDALNKLKIRLCRNYFGRCTR